MSKLSVLLMLIWFVNWLVTSSANPIDIEALISFKIDADGLDLHESKAWLQIWPQLSSGEPRTQGTPAIITCTADPFVLPTAASVASPTVATTTTALPTPEAIAACSDVFSRVGDHCYHFSRTTATFNDASIACHSLGAALAHPKNSEENSLLTQYIRENKEKDIQAWWIGAADRDKEGQWVWTHDKSPVVYTDWLSGEPNDANENEHCAQYRKKADYKWNDVPCNNKYQYICQYVGLDDDSGEGTSEEVIPSVITTTAAPLAVSQSDFVQLGVHSYYFSTTTATFDQASKACQSIDTQLTHPRNSKENSKLTQYIRENKKTAIGWWIGATDGDKEGQWVWTHDKSPVLYTHWLSGEPNNEYDNEDCAHLRKDVNYKWNDASCENKYHYICQSEDSNDDSQGEPSGEMELSAEVEDEIKQPTINPFRHHPLYPVRNPFLRGNPWSTRHYGRSFGHYA